jgi:hypothetical protein
MPNWQPNWNNVRWDWGASDAAAQALRQTADRLDQGTGDRQQLASQAQIDWRGRYRNEFDDELARLVSRARGLAAELRQAADRIQYAANRAYDEQRHRESERRRWNREREDEERREQERRRRHS